MPAFPATGLLDDFNRASLGANWSGPMHTTTVATLGEGDGYGARVIGNVLTVYQYTGGEWILRDTVIDDTLSGPGYIGWGYQGGADGPEADDFSGGSVPSLALVRTWP
jgi:hypothetical protein